MSFVITVFLAYTVLLSMITGQLPSSSINPSLLGVYIISITVMSAACVFLTVKILGIHHRDESIPVTDTVIRVTRALQTVMRRRKKTNRNSVHPVDDEEPTEDDTKKPNEDDVTWKQFAHELDALMFWVSVFITVLCIIGFLLAITIPPYVMYSIPVEHVDESAMP